MKAMGLAFFLHIFPISVGAVVLVGLKLLFHGGRLGRALAVVLIAAVPVTFVGFAFINSLEKPRWSIKRANGDYWRLSMDKHEKSELVVSKNHLRNHTWAKQYERDFRLTTTMDTFSGGVSSNNEVFVWTRNRSAKGIEIVGASHKTGVVIWRKWLPGEPFRVPDRHCVSANRCFVHAGGNSVYCLNVKTGKVCWENGLTQGWFGRDDVTATTGFVCDSGRIFVGICVGGACGTSRAPDSGYILCLDETTGRQLHRIPLDYPVQRLLCTKVDDHLWLAASLFHEGDRRPWVAIRDDGRQIGLGVDVDPCRDCLFVGAKEYGQDPVIIRTLQRRNSVFLKADGLLLEERDIGLIAVCGEDYHKKILLAVKNEGGRRSLSSYTLSGFEKLWEYDDEDITHASFMITDKAVTVFAKRWTFTSLSLLRGRVIMRGMDKEPRKDLFAEEQLRYETRFFYCPCHFPDFLPLY